MTEIPDLAWDYTGDSPLLHRAVSPVCRQDDSCRLTHRQTQYLMRSLGESVQIIRSARQQFHSPRNGDAVHADSDDDVFDAGRCSSIKKFFGEFIAKTCGYVAILAILLQLLAVLIESVWDAIENIGSKESHHPIVQAVISPICLILMSVVYFEAIRRIQRKELTFSVWIKSFISSTVTFAGVYSIFLRFDTVADHEVYVVTYLKTIHYAISVFTLTGSYLNAAMYDCWYALTALTLQMLIAYCHLIVIVTHFSHFIAPVTEPYVPLPNATATDFHTPVQREERILDLGDTDSLLFVTPQSGPIYTSSGINERDARARDEYGERARYENGARDETRARGERGVRVRGEGDDVINSAAHFEDVPDCDMLLGSHSI